MEYPHLSHAPIVEGLIDILVKPRSDLTLDDLVCLSEKLKSKYPEVKALHTIQTDVQIDQSQRALQSVATALVGYRLERKDLPFVLMLRVNGLTISRLRPYEDWNRQAAQPGLVRSFHKERPQKNDGDDRDRCKEGHPQAVAMLGEEPESGSRVSDIGEVEEAVDDRDGFVQLHGLLNDRLCDLIQDENRPDHGGQKKITARLFGDLLDDGWKRHLSPPPRRSGRRVPDGPGCDRRPHDRTSIAHTSFPSRAKLEWQAPLL